VTPAPPPAAHPGATTFLVRHAEAGWRHAWQGDDRDRPLTYQGRRQAEGLPRLLDGQPIARVLSSPYRRCVETVEPLAGARRLLVEATEELAEGAGAEPALALLAAGAIVACTHGDVVEAVLDLLEGSGVPLQGRAPGLETLKGAVWVFTCGAGAAGGAGAGGHPAGIVAGRLRPPP
jgi:phosphohistidine phosphatase SixA